MALERNVGPVWSSPALTLTEDTIFQVHAGAVYLDIGGTAVDDDDGLLLVQDPARPLRDTVTIPAGVDVRWRRAGERTAKLYYAPLA
jgi:hypothetical protein